LLTTADQRADIGATDYFESAGINRRAAARISSIDISITNKGFTARAFDISTAELLNDRTNALLAAYTGETNAIMCGGGPW
jgi:hypothetical protein